MPPLELADVTITIPQPPDRTKVVLASLILDRIKQFTHLKRFFLSFAFVCTYLLLNQLRIDWINARDTHSFYELARVNTDQLSFDKRTKLTQQVDFLNTDLDRLTTELQKVCADCEVAVTDKASDLKNMVSVRARACVKVHACS